MKRSFVLPAPSLLPRTAPAYLRSPTPENAPRRKALSGLGSAIRQGKAFGNTAVAYLGAFPNLAAMARDSRKSASDVIQFLEDLTVADLDQVIAEAERQREARRESGKKELVEEFRAKAAAMGLSLEELLRTPASPGRESAPASERRIAGGFSGSKVPQSRHGRDLVRARPNAKMAGGRGGARKAPRRVRCNALMAVYASQWRVKAFELAA